MNTAKPLSTRHGRTIIQHKGQLIATRTLKYADKCWKSGREKDAIEIYAMLLPFILPKLQAVELDSNINLAIDAQSVRKIYEEIIKSRQEQLSTTDIREIPGPSDAGNVIS